MRKISIVFALAIMAWSMDALATESSQDLGTEVAFMPGGGDPLALFEGLPCQLEAIAGGVRCTVDEMVLQEFLHPSLYPGPRQYRERSNGRAPVAPVEVGGAAFYGIDNDVVRFDLVDRRITGRVRLPAPVLKIDGEGEQLAVTVEERLAGQPLEPGGQADHPTQQVVIAVDPHRLEAPGRGPWDWSGTLAALHDVMWLDEMDLNAEPGASEYVSQRSTEEELQALSALQRREEFDGANPFLALYRGEILQRIGDEEGAQRAFEEAVAHDHGDWIDNVRIGMRLEIRDQSDLADAAFERGERQMGEEGVRGEYVTAMVHATFALVWLHHGIGQAMRSGESDRANRVAAHVDDLFPNLEGAPSAWARLAVYFEAQNEPQLAEEWRHRATAAQGERKDGPGRLFEQAATAVDRVLIIQVGLFLTLLLSGLVLGLWRVEEDAIDAREMEPRQGAEWKEYLPRFYVGDLVMLVAIFFALFMLPMTAAPKVASMITFAEAPATISGDAIAAPSAGQWIEELSPGNARDALAQVSSRELEATKLGAKAAGDAQLNDLVRGAIEADTAQRRIRHFASLEASAQMKHEFQWLPSLVDTDFGPVKLGISSMVLAVIALIFGALFQAVGRRFRWVRRLGLKVVPGAPNSLRALRLFVLAIFVVGLLMMTPLSQAVEASTEASLVGHFGLSEAPRELATTMPTMGAVLVAVALILHAIGVVMDPSPEVPA